MMGLGRVSGKQSDATETRPGRFEYLRQNLYSYLPHLIANYRTVGASRVGLFQCRRRRRASVERPRAQLVATEIVQLFQVEVPRFVA